MLCLAGLSRSLCGTFGVCLYTRLDCNKIPPCNIENDASFHRRDAQSVKDIFDDRSRWSMKFWSLLTLAAMGVTVLLMRLKSWPINGMFLVSTFPTSSDPSVPIGSPASMRNLLISPWTHVFDSLGQSENTIMISSMMESTSATSFVRWKGASVRLRNINVALLMRRPSCVCRFSNAVTIMFVVALWARATAQVKPIGSVAWAGRSSVPSCSTVRTSPSST